MLTYRPVPFEGDWGKKYITYGLKLFGVKTSDRSKNLPLVAEYYGFEEQWKLYEVDEKSNDLSVRIRDMIVMKSKFANRGKGGMAVSCSPREGMHRMIALSLKMMGCRFNPVEG